VRIAREEVGLNQFNVERGGDLRIDAGNQELTAVANKVVVVL
jgi:hypothetical protein